jgi:tetratricopeptide (TPR) repeat protein
VVAALLFLNVRYQAVWHDERTLWAHAATTYPNQPRVHNNYGAALQAAGLEDEAIAQFDIALRVLPTFADAYCNRGSSEGQLHHYSEALTDETRALELDRTDAGCWYNRAVTLYSLQRFGEALEDVEQAEKLGDQPPPGFKEAVQRRLAATR